MHEEHARTHTHSRRNIHAQKTTHAVHHFKLYAADRFAPSRGPRMEATSPHVTVCSADHRTQSPSHMTRPRGTRIGWRLAPLDPQVVHLRWLDLGVSVRDLRRLAHPRGGLPQMATAGLRRSRLGVVAVAAVVAAAAAAASNYLQRGVLIKTVRLRRDARVRVLARTAGLRHRSRRRRSGRRVV